MYIFIYIYNPMYFIFQGDFKPLREWLRNNVHEVGKKIIFPVI
jgi:Zn-dependent M32 family carboxypeptidase